MKLDEIKMKFRAELNELSKKYGVAFAIEETRNKKISTAKIYWKGYYTHPAKVIEHPDYSEVLIDD